MDELDPNRVVADLLKNSISTFFDATKETMISAKWKLYLKFERFFKDYLTQISNKHIKAKTFFIREQPVDFYDFYVPIDISCKENKIETVDFKKLTDKSSYTVITGNAGCGKSILMRHLLLSCIVYKCKIPVFIELRRLNVNNIELIDLIKLFLSENGLKCGPEIVELALEDGRFAIMLDGYDEVKHKLREKLIGSILVLSTKYYKNSFIVSSRPENQFSGWNNYSIYCIDPLSVSQAVDLLEKLNYDEGIKETFISKLKDELYDKHKSFLSNPLLLSIMLLTSSHSSNIPDKLSVFYNQAYEAMFQRHDALKSGFNRERLSKLDIQDFARVFLPYQFKHTIKEFLSSQNRRLLNIWINRSSF